MSIPFDRMGAFTDQLLGGNPAEICLLSEVREEHWVQYLEHEDIGFSQSEFEDFLVYQPPPNNARTRIRKVPILFI